MVNEFKRTDRVAQMMQRKLAQIIQQEIKDPRLPRFITVAEVKVSPDLAYAKVYITILGDEDKIDDTLLILNNASSFLRTALARSVKLRIIPHLQFIYDTTIEYGNKLSKLIDDVAPDDKEDD